MVLRYNPRSELARAFEEMDRVATTRRQGGHTTVAIQPAIDLYDRGDELVLRALLPGVRPEDLELTLEQNTITIAGRFGYQLGEDEGKNLTWYRKEIGAGRFSETFSLPVPVEADAIQAQFEDGVLSVVLPKAQQARMKRIEIQSQSPKALEFSQN